MLYVEFADIRCSALGFGCSGVMGRVGRRESLLAMHTAWNAGITLFDTARSYGYGEAEGLLGEFLHGKREQATIVTKFGIIPEKLPRWKREVRPLVRALLRVAPEPRAAVRRANATEMTPGHFDVATLRTSLETSLRELRTEYVDMLLAHEAPARSSCTSTSA
jgi:aryl-alcohol dehydrogenase-like predicted oxidoreductase